MKPPIDVVTCEGTAATSALIDIQWERKVEVSWPATCGLANGAGGSGRDMGRAVTRLSGAGTCQPPEWPAPTRRPISRLQRGRRRPMAALHDEEVAGLYKARSGGRGPAHQ